MHSIEDVVYKFPTKYKEGFTQEEMESLLQGYSRVNISKFNNALMGVSCRRVSEEIVIYHCDVVNALKCAIEDRDLNESEWD